MEPFQMFSLWVATQRLLSLYWANDEYRLSYLLSIFNSKADDMLMDFQTKERLQCNRSDFVRLQMRDKSIYDLIGESRFRVRCV